MARNFSSFEEFSITHKKVNRVTDKATREGIDSGLKWTVRCIKSNYFRSSGEPGPGYIVSRSRKLINSIKATRAKNVGGKGKIYGSIKMGGRGIPYAEILERGGRTSPHIIVPKKASVLHFFTKSGTEVFTKKVMHPGSVIEPRAVLGRGAVRGTPEIMKRVVQAQRKAFKRTYG